MKNQPDQNRTQKGILNGKACTKEQFRNDSPPNEFARVWALRNDIAGKIRLAITLCSTT